MIVTCVSQLPHKPDTEVAFKLPPAIDEACLATGNTSAEAQI